MNNSFTDQLIADDRKFLWHPFTPMKSWCEDKDIVVIERGENEFLIDTNGDRYIDAVSSLWCNVHGHNVHELNEAFIGQTKRVAHSTLLGLANIPSIELARRLIQLAQQCGLNLSKIFYSDNGSTAVEVAAKMAYQYWRNKDPAASQTRFIAFEASYHGDTLGAVSMGGIELFHSVYRSLCFPVDFVQWEPAAAAEFILSKVEELLQRNANAYAAVIIEPLIQGAGGMRMFPQGTLKGLRELCNRYNTLLIADEVMTGFGRTGKMFACEHEHVTPDLLCLSKGLTAGYLPLGATLATQKIFDAFYADPNGDNGANIVKTFFHGHTFTGNPLACSVAIASLDLFEKTNLLRHVNKALVPILDETLEKASENAYVANARRCGLIGAIDLVDRDTKQPFPYHYRIGGALCTRMRQLHVLSRPLADTLVIMPPLAITAENFRTLCNAYLQSLEWITDIVAEKKSAY